MTLEDGDDDKIDIIDQGEIIAAEWVPLRELENNEQEDKKYKLF